MATVVRSTVATASPATRWATLLTSVSYVPALPVKASTPERPSAPVTCGAERTLQRDVQVSTGWRPKA